MCCMSHRRTRTTHFVLVGGVTIGLEVIGVACHRGTRRSVAACVACPINDAGTPNFAHFCGDVISIQVIGSACPRGTCRGVAVCVACPVGVAGTTSFAPIGGVVIGLGVIGAQVNEALVNPSRNTHRRRRGNRLLHPLVMSLSELKRLVPRVTVEHNVASLHVSHVPSAKLGQAAA